MFLVDKIQQINKKIMSKPKYKANQLIVRLKSSFA